MSFGISFCDFSETGISFLKSSSTYPCLGDIQVDDSEPFDTLEFLARVLIHIPEPNKQASRSFLGKMNPILSGARYNL